MSAEETGTSANIRNLTSLYPTYALRAWLTALLAQTQRAQSEMQESIRKHESEIEHLRQQLEQSGGIVKSLENAIQRVDNALRHKRDVDVTGEEHHKRKPNAAEESRQEFADEEDALKKK